MLNLSRICLAMCCLFLVACGDSDSATEPNASLVKEDKTSECGQGGTWCPDGLECVTWRDGSQACGPESVEAVVLLKDATLGGSCLSPNPADPLPGASIASIHVIDNDGDILGFGRLVWDQAGYEVADERGTPPDGSGEVDDACVNYYNLGCEGLAVFEIVDDRGQAQKLREGQIAVAHMRGQETCGEEVADDVEAAVCNDPVAAAAGDTSSCTYNVNMTEAREDMYGADRMGGTIQYIGKKE